MSSASQTTAGRPRRISSYAAVRPAGPAPRTTTGPSGGVLGFPNSMAAHRNQTHEIAVAGCGRITERGYLPALRRRPELRLAALCDPDPARLATAASAAERVLGSAPRTYAGAEELLARRVARGTDRRGAHAHPPATRSDGGGGGYPGADRKAARCRRHRGRPPRRTRPPAMDRSQPALPAGGRAGRQRPALGLAGAGPADLLSACRVGCARGGRPGAARCRRSPDRPRGLPHRIAPAGGPRSAARSGGGGVRARAGAGPRADHRLHGGPLARGGRGAGPGAAALSQRAV